MKSKSYRINFVLLLVAVFCVSGISTASASDSLIIANWGGSQVFSTNGASQHSLTTIVTGLAGGAAMATFGPNGNLFVSEYGTSKVHQYAAGTWTNLGVYADASATGSAGTAGLSFGHDGKLYIGADAHLALVADGTTTSVLRDLWLYAQRGTATGPDGRVYFASQAGLTAGTGDGVISVYDPATATWNDAGSLYDAGDPSGISFGPDYNSDGWSDLYIADWYGGIYVRSGQDGSALGKYLDTPYGMLDVIFSDAGTMYYSVHMSHQVFRYQNGVSTLVADNSDGLFYVGGLALANEYVPVGPAVPEPGSLLALGSGLVGFLAFASRRRK